MFSLLLSGVARAENIEDNLSKLDSILRVHTGLYYINPPTMGRVDSIYRSRDGYSKMIYYDTDSIYRQVVRKGWATMGNELHCYYADVIPNLTPGKRKLEFEKLKKLAKELKSKELEKEVKSIEFENFSADEKNSRADVIAKRKVMAEEYAKERDTLSLIHSFAMINRFGFMWGLYPDAFEAAHQVLPLIEEYSKSHPDQEFNSVFYYMGEAYYRFGEYENAVPCFKKALKNTRYFGERTNLQARNSLGLYYRSVDSLDLSDSYFRSMLESKDIVKFRKQYDAIAICNLGKNCLLRKEYQKATVLLEKGLPPMLEALDYPFSAGVAINLGSCYLALGDLSRTKTMIDSAKTYIQVHNSTTHYPSLYQLMSQYYARIGDGEKAAAYIDSLVIANNSYKKEYNASHVLRVEKKMLMAEREVQKQKLDIERLEKENYRSNLQFSLMLLGLVVTLLLIYIFLYRKKQEAYRALVVKNQEWAKKTSTENDTPKEENKNGEFSTTDDQSICERIQDYLIKEKAYKNPDITLDSLADSMNITRNNLSQAINRCTGKNFNRFINEFRVKESINLMSDKNHKNDTVEVIAELSGFKSNSSFYEAFKNITGLTPAQFKRNR